MKRYQLAIALFSPLIVLLIPTSASSQNVDHWLDRKYAIQKQQADADSKRAEAERMHAETEQKRVESQSASSSQTSSSSSVESRPIPQGDALAADAPACTLQNGSAIRTTGGFRPSLQSGVVCKK